MSKLRDCCRHTKDAHNEYSGRHGEYRSDLESLGPAPTGAESEHHRSPTLLAASQFDRIPPLETFPSRHAARAGCNFDGPILRGYGEDQAKITEPKPQR